ncbi:MAG: hypothetical protein KFH98_06940 [Gemmatimonadetes bacterium]|nr:hypothetical protein [Gemmatimonadota bacterium]
MLRIAPLMLAAGLATGPAALAYAEVDVSLKGSRASMLRQNEIAKQEAFSFLRTPTQVHNYVDFGYLVQLEGNDDYDVIAGYPFARDVVRAFVERLAQGYREACGERLVVTSLTRPADRQPGNASALSVHPAGMAVDLRVSGVAACREWLSVELLRLETMGLLDATLERRPPHYHVAVFPVPYGEYDAIQSVAEAESERLAQEMAAIEARLALALLELRPEQVEMPLRTTLIVRLASVVALLFLPLSIQA